MKNTSIVFTCLFLFLGCAWAIADNPNSADPSSCAENFDISSLPLNSPLIKENLSDLEGYFTCKAAMKEDINMCDIFSGDPSKTTNCRDAYNRYYISFGKLYRDGHVSAEELENCLQRFKTKSACDQLGRVLLSGNPDDCAKIDGITPDNMDICKNMASSDPTESTRAIFMSILRKGDPALCDQIDIPPVAAICKGLLSKNVDGCQLNAGVDHFKQIYCQNSPR